MTVMQEFYKPRVVQLDVGCWRWGVLAWDTGTARYYRYETAAWDSCDLTGVAGTERAAARFAGLAVTEAWRRLRICAGWDEI